MRTLTHKLPIPGLLHGRYPERRAPRHDLLDTLLGARRRSYVPFAEAVRGLQEASRRLSDEDCARESAVLRQLFARRGFDDAVMQRAFALISEVVSSRMGLTPHPGQIIAARAMLDRRLVEMPTGEGKTLAAAIAAATAALARVPVHVITANEYLARRDADKLRPVFAALGLKVGVVTHELGTEARREAYACDIAYCTAKELVFDYLRDSLLRRAAPGELRARARSLALGATGTVLRGLCMAIVDEADSVLIDEARVPFILARAADDRAKRAHYERALSAAREFALGEDYTIDAEMRQVKLTARGQDKAEREAQAGDTPWRIRRLREEALCQALAALHLFERDRHYLVRRGAVEIIDDTTGRVAAGRAWSRGLHQFIELKEGCVPSSENVTAAQITYQRFFSRYLHLCGMSGTLTESRAELLETFGLRVARVAPRRPCRRTLLPTRVFGSHDARWRFVVERAGEIQARGGAVLIGTDSVADSQALSARLHAARLAHVVLNARQDRHEAEVVAKAGNEGRITVATSMAGRGTDIELAEKLARGAGLHVILCQANASGRIDRQFIGRCARRGEPGSCETLLSLESAPIASRLPAWVLGLTRGELRPRWIARLVARFPLWLEERLQRRMRRRLRNQDEALEGQPILGGTDS